MLRFARICCLTKGRFLLIIPGRIRKGDLASLGAKTPLTNWARRSQQKFAGRVRQLAGGKEENECRVRYSRTEMREFHTA